MVFFPICDPKFFFQKSGSVTFAPLQCSNFMQKIRKNLQAVSEIFKEGPTDNKRTTDGWTRAITKDTLGRTRGPIMNIWRLSWTPTENCVCQLSKKEIGLHTILTTGLFLIFLARLAYLRVFIVSCTACDEGEMHAI